MLFEPDLQSNFFHNDATPSVAWSGTGWQASQDGTAEIKAYVVEVPDGFVPALDVSYGGGDPDTALSEKLETIEAAIAAAETLASDWHSA